MNNENIVNNGATLDDLSQSQVETTDLMWHTNKMLVMSHSSS